MNVPLAVRRSLKSPFRKACGGTVAILGSLRRNRYSSQLKKKNVRFLTMGPPTEAPNWL